MTEQTKPNDGGPAFPVPTISGPDLTVSYPEHVRGMTLLDWFAGQIQFSPDEPSVYEAKAVMKEEPPTWPPFGTSVEYDQMEKCVLWWAKARARLRMIEADAMLAAGEARNA